MKISRLMLMVAAAGPLAACEMQIGNETAESAEVSNVSAEGKSAEGQLSISAPGFKMKLDIPAGIRTGARIDNDSGIIYPGARFSGIHVEGGREGPGGESEGEVELRFASSDSPEAIALWYRDPARNSDFAVANASKAGDTLRLAGAMKEDGGRFEVSLAPGTEGGTDGRILLSERH